MQENHLGLGRELLSLDWSEREGSNLSSTVEVIGCSLAEGSRPLCYSVLPMSCFQLRLSYSTPRESACSFARALSLSLPRPLRSSSAMPKVKKATTRAAVEEHPLPTDFNAQVYDVVRRIPEGRVRLSHLLYSPTVRSLSPTPQVCSYGTIAKLLHRPQNSRLVGQALKLLPRALSSPHLPQPDPPPDAGEDYVLPAPPLNPDFVPWHRVVASSGVISPRGNDGAVRRQADFLRAEGVEVRDGPRAGPVRGGNGEGGGPPEGVDAFGLGGAGAEGGRVSMATYGWEG